ncbi:hypothetical protein GLOIN_2v1470651 [Rhizophagus irregularis DAOM 181602=DAOM 197198]|uniref:Protein kinase domain-containing protein n=2 Tax=Rhizophagus irregularis TaxID=588596 RepID=A0A015ICU4_RHIIW|nr:hypothetical protein GLOIN_2v1470651 [Rhizophagus irregularis DAOM 181602=DAOM 197198]EXX51665.1 hypothetical protein RirG_259770 [Rhizophagus irregularis DAOM 197198w]POG81535.1 hypothetical protein GLOIN_2v1470651 [Rhizophagus irregularis DAOM 181602=DAOM 197198]|eukprot:XP_025188401.1 hypothetical protein GLOIN_2v1470651 [Rhizophagus irregularis DAOM 181602=DAOM 197198]
MTKGGCNKIYSANWISEEYVKWNSKERQLTFKVVLKELGNIEAANRSWFDEAKSHLILSNKYTDFVGCCGLTQDSSSGNYMLVMHLLDMDLRKYLQKHQCTWEEKIHVVWHLIVALRRIHYNDAIHRDLHSGNVLYSQ